MKSSCLLESMNVLVSQELFSDIVEATKAIKAIKTTTCWDHCL